MKRSNQRGFTLTELLIALFVLSVVLLALSTMVYSVMRATTQSKGMAAATTLAQDRMERLKNINFGALASGSNSTTLGNIAYNCDWNIGASGNIKTITVTVSWTDRVSHSISLTSLWGG